MDFFSLRGAGSLLCASVLAACASAEIDDPTTFSSGLQPGSGTSSDTTTGPGPDGSTSADGTSTTTEGMDATGPGCPEEDTPVIISSTDPIMLMAGQTSVSFDLEFDREVFMEDGGLIVTGGATVAAPVLPQTSTVFGVTLEDLDPSSSYVFTVDAGAVFDDCSRTMASSVDIELMGDCSANVPPASTTVEFHQLPGGTVTDSYEVSFSESVTLQAGAISVVGGTASIDSITPALPAASDTFVVELSGLGDIGQLRVDAALVEDACGAGLDGSFDLWVCTVEQVQFGYTGAPEQLQVPGCAQGMVTLDVAGAQGLGAAGGGSGGLGGQASGSLMVDSGEVLAIYVGGQNGFNGGGAAGLGDPVASGNGGGASDVRQGGSTLADRVVVAGGGGGGAAPPQGSCSSGVGGSGGAAGGANGTTGTNGTGCGATVAGGGGGGTQVAGGAGGISGGNCTVTPAPGAPGTLGVGGDGSNALDCNGSGFTGGGGGGGGGGYYGGGGAGGGPGGGGGSWGGGGGGGGSSYVGGVIGGSTTAGTQAGDGQVTVSW